MIMASFSLFHLCAVSPGTGTHRSVRPHLLLRTPRNKTQRIHSTTPPDGDQSATRFLDDDGVVEDMDGYLNYLSLEYDSVWDTKPAWCQPWTITLTGASVVAGSWLVLHNIIATSVASVLIGTWWYIFLYSYPKAYTEMIAERRKKVTSGVEDTFGLKNSP